MIVFKDLIGKTYISTHIPFTTKIIFTNYGNSFSLSYVSNDSKIYILVAQLKFNATKFF